MITAKSTAAASDDTDSSGCTLTIPAQPDVTAWLSHLIVFHGPSQATSAVGAITISGLVVPDIDIPFVHTPTTTAVINLVFDFSSIAASATDSPITITVPAILGAGETTLLVEGGYF